MFIVYTWIVKYAVTELGWRQYVSILSVIIKLLVTSDVNTILSQVHKIIFDNGSITGIELLWTVSMKQINSMADHSSQLHKNSCVKNCLFFYVGFDQ
jgi:hypothetical protein